MLGHAAESDRAFREPRADMLGAGNSAEPQVCAEFGWVERGGGSNVVKICAQMKHNTTHNLVPWGETYSINELFSYVWLLNQPPAAPVRINVAANHSLCVCVYVCA